MLLDPPTFPKGEVERAAYIRRDLRWTLAHVTVQPFDSAQYVTFAAPLDSALLRHPPRQQVSVSYGYETTLHLVWMPRAWNFRVIWSCC